MSKGKTTAEFIEELNKINPNIEVLGEYVQNKVKILCKCKVCENEWEVVPSGLLRGHGCPKCSIKKVGEAKRKSQDDFIKELLEVNPNIEVMGEYTTCHTKILCKCKVDGNEWRATPSDLLRGQGCPKCGINKCSRRKSKDDFVKELLEINSNITPLEDYAYARDKMLFACKICGHAWKATPDSVLRGQGCPKCAGVAKLTHEEFVNKVSKVSPTIKITTPYIRNSDKVGCLCTICGNEWYATPNNLTRGTGCRICYRKSTMNLDLTEEERVSKRCYPEYTEFTNNVLKRDDFTCQLTLNSGNVVVHHLDGYNWCVEKRTDVNNGITLSEDMHKEFHNRYGRGNNTKQQFVEFVSDLYKENRITRSAYEWVMSERLK